MARQERRQREPEAGEPGRKPEPVAAYVHIERGWREALAGRQRAAPGRQIQTEQGEKREQSSGLAWGVCCGRSVTRIVACDRRCRTVALLRGGGYSSDWREWGRWEPSEGEDKGGKQRMNGKEKMAGGLGLNRNNFPFFNFFI